MIYEKRALEKRPHKTNQHLRGPQK